MECPGIAQAGLSRAGLGLALLRWDVQAWNIACSAARGLDWPWGRLVMGWPFHVGWACHWMGCPWAEVDIGWTAHGLVWPLDGLAMG
jgi:hypothetical protein